jgi:hypothetical protein
MSNYFQLIQNISKIKLGKSPTLFSDTTNKRYNKIINALSDSLEDFFLSSSHNLREKQSSFLTVASQQGYIHVYGEILQDGLQITDSDNNITTIKFTPNYQRLLKLTDTGLPSQYSIFNGKILFYPIPDDVYTITVLYNTDKWVNGLYEIDSESESEQDKLYLTSTTGLSTNDVVVIEPDTAREEVVVIDSITSDDYLTLTENLVYTHPVGGSVILHKSILEYETDEPNFPAKYHKILEYDALKRLYYADEYKLVKYTGLYNDKHRQIVVESRGSEDSTGYFSINGMDYVNRY